MATDKNFIQYVVEQLRGLSGVSTRPMFGEYGVYVDGVMVLLVCDNTAFVKILPETTEMLGEDCERGYPYDGAREHYILDVDDRELSEEVCSMLSRLLPPPKKKRKSV